MEEVNSKELTALKQQLDEERSRRLRAEQNLYYTNLMLNMSCCPMMTIDRNQRITYTNNAFLKLFGGNRTHYVGKTLKEAIRWESIEDIDTIIESIYAENGRKVHLKCLNAEQERLLVQLDAQVLLSPKGTPFQLVINFIDKSKDLQPSWL